MPRLNRNKKRCNVWYKVYSCTKYNIYFNCLSILSNKWSSKITMQNSTKDIFQPHTPSSTQRNLNLFCSFVLSCILIKKNFQLNNNVYNVQWQVQCAPKAKSTSSIGGWCTIYILQNKITLAIDWRGEEPVKCLLKVF